MTNSKKEYVFLGTLMSITALSGLILSSPSSHADTSGTVTLTVDVPASCSLTVDPSSHTATINPGNTGLIGTSTIKPICNDPAGLAVYAVGYTGDTYGNNNLSTTVGSNTINIPTNVTPSGTPESSEWYMTLAAVSGDYTPTITTGYDSAHIIPNVYTKVAYRNTMTDIGTNATGAQFTASFNAYIAPTQAAGTYTGKVKFLLVHPNVLTYNDQTGEPDTVQPSTFAMDPDTIVGDCSPNSPLLQNVSSWGSSVALEEEIDVIDSRDNQCYKVKRLKMNSDGSQTALWMMSNLNLGAQALTVSTLDSTNTNLPASGDNDIDVATTFNSWVKSSGTGSYTTPELIPITASNSATSSATDSYGNKYGTLYNFAAASAGTYVIAKNSIGDSRAQYDLCPSGWRLPYGNSNGEFKKLITDGYSIASSADGATALQSTLKFPLAGRFTNSTPVDQGSKGYYWSSMRDRDASDSMYTLYFYSSYVGPAYGGGYRSHGYSIRCIAP